MFLPNPGVLAAGAGGPANWQALYEETFDEVNSYYNAVIPAGFSSVSMVAIGMGEWLQEGHSLTRGGRGGDLRYVNDVPVNPAGETLRVVFSADGYCGVTRLDTTVLVRAAYGRVSSAFSQGTGFNGGVSSGSSTQSRPGGGAGGYTSNGTSSNTNIWRGGQGSDPYGRRLTGSGVRASNATDGEDYGGGGGKVFGDTRGGIGGKACVRIIAGPGRAFPNTLTEDMS